MFSFLEKNPFFFTVAFLLVFSIAGLVEVLPGFAKKAQPIEGLKPYSLLETAGRQVYIAEGCYNCHSQLIRPFKAETDRYGAYSLSGEYAYDRPFLWGSKRTGPDLHRVGDRLKSVDWHDGHMRDPKSRVPGSIMPAYEHLYTKNTDFETAFAEAYTQKVVFGVPYDTENGVQIGAESYKKGDLSSLAKAKEIFMQEAKVVVDDMVSQDVKEAFEKGEVKQIVALIAYMNSLGQSRRVGATPSQAQ
ncbi:cytochrome-c oxidase, cbb3-type subunit II [Helicobacter jaachi]|uniref:Cytochrome-c oxidase, cbb3-type subunit II n=1 Tax=Helicobacter jaachi TaxID=1677920 RepID=A0A4U8TBH2_9HELI|nr:cytochrome-c oxidase, cbb3-type subunit II [Helicobacter jaachi]TLD97235.1 cytochrome-c oxidase, cbb3-type subunit II [Helicobacter jaachi]